MWPRSILFPAVLTLIFPTSHSFPTTHFAVGRRWSGQHGNLGLVLSPRSHAGPSRNKVGVLVEDVGRPHLKMQDLERAYDAMITAFACILALFFLNVWASLCVLILKGGVVQRTPTILAAIAALTQQKVLDFVAGPRSRHLLGLTPHGTQVEVAASEPSKEGAAASATGDVGSTRIDNHLQPMPKHEQQIADSALEAEEEGGNTEAQSHFWGSLASDLVLIAFYNAKVAVRAVISNAGNNLRFASLCNSILKGKIVALVEPPTGTDCPIHQSALKTADNLTETRDV